MVSTQKIAVSSKIMPMAFQQFGIKVSSFLSANVNSNTIDIPGIQLSSFFKIILGYIYGSFSILQISTKNVGSPGLWKPCIAFHLALLPTRGHFLGQLRKWNHCLSLETFSASWSPTHPGVPWLVFLIFPLAAHTFNDTVFYSFIYLLPPPLPCVPFFFPLR